MQSCHSANFPGGIDEGEYTFIHIYIYIYIWEREGRATRLGIHPPPSSTMSKRMRRPTVHKTALKQKERKKNSELKRCDRGKDIKTV